MSAVTNPKCNACGRVTATHALGCSLLQCPNRRPDVWDGPDGPRGLPGTLAEERILRRRSEADRAVPVDIEDL